MTEIERPNLWTRLPDRPTNSRKLRNIAGGALWFFGLATMALFFILTFTWPAAAPHFPDQRTGAIYTHNTHGDITYLTAFQATSLACLMPLSIACAISGFAIIPKRNVRVASRTFAFAMKFDQDDPEKTGRTAALIGVVSALIIDLGVGPAFVHLLNSNGLVPHF